LLTLQALWHEPDAVSQFNTQVVKAWVWGMIEGSTGTGGGSGVKVCCASVCAGAQTMPSINTAAASLALISKLIPVLLWQVRNGMGALLSYVAPMRRSNACGIKELEALASQGNQGLQLIVVPCVVRCHWFPPWDQPIRPAPAAAGRPPG
jgi:hypothetical protein